MPRPKKEKRRRVASPYALFVKKHYPSTRDKFSRPQERIKHIAQLWRDERKIRSLLPGTPRERKRGNASEMTPEKKGNLWDTTK